MQPQPHPLASLSSTARYGSPVRTSDAAFSSAHSSRQASPTPHSPDDYARHPHGTQPSRGIPVGENGSMGAMVTPAAGAGSGKRRRITDDGDRTSEEPHGGSKRSKVLSCTECKRRKVKCDRKIPCLACCRRGEPEACKWPDEHDKPQVDVQPFALTGDLLVLAQRIQSLEEWTQTLPPELREAAPLPQVFQPSLYGTTSKQKAQEMGKSLRAARPRPRDEPAHKVEIDDEHSFDAPSRDLSETEDAALQLESIAFATRLPDSQYRPNDSLPLIDSVASPSATASHNKAGQDTNAALARELTAWGTSILAQPITYEGPWSGPALGLELCFSNEHLRANYRRALDSIWPHMPDRQLSNKLTTKYFEEIAWLHPIFHRPTFEAEHARAWEMIQGGRREEIDPLWLSCYFLVLALAVDGLRSNERSIDLDPEETARCNSLVWYGCANRLIQLGNGVGRAQVRFIMATILIGQWLQTSSVNGRVTAFLTILAGAIRTAQILGLHQLGTDPSVMPPLDPAWPPAACSMRRESALRLFYMLLFYDCMSASTRFRSYLLDLRQCTSPEPSNLNWKDLSVTDWRIEPKPRNTLTDMSFEHAKHRSCEAYRMAFDKLLSPAAELSYATIIELDRLYRSALSECLQALQAGIADASGGEVTTAQWKRAVCEDGLHSRLVRLHRPFMTQYEGSRKACLESANQILQIHSRIARMSRNVWFIYTHCLSAAICLFVDLFHAIDHDRSLEDIEERRSTLSIALDVFGHADEVRSPSLRVVVQTGYGILRGLFEASEARRTARAAQALMGRTGNDQAAPESFAAVLQRLTRQLSVEGPPQSAKPAPASGTKASGPLSAGPQPFTPGPPLAPDSLMSRAPVAPSFGHAPAAQAGNAPVDYSYLAGNTAEYMPTEFFRDVGLTPGVGINLDYLNSGAAVGNPMQDGNGTSFAATQGPPASYELDPTGLSGPYDWPLFGAADATGEQGKLAASALMDQLSTGLW